MATVQQLRVQAKARKIPQYYKMSKPQLMGALGMAVPEKSVRQFKQESYKKQQQAKTRARSTAKQHGIAKTFAADKIGGKLGGGDAAKKEAIKSRIVKSVSRELKAHEKKIGRKLTIEEKRGVAVKALAKEVRAIKSGVPEQKRRGAAENKAAKQAAKEKVREYDRESSAMSQKVRDRAIASGKTEQEANQEAFKAFQSRSTVMGRRIAEAEKKAKLSSVDGGKVKKRMAIVDGGTSAKGKSRAKLSAVEGGQKSLGDLFKEVDREMGDKYRTDKNEPANMHTHREARKLINESGLGEVGDRLSGKKTKRQTDKARLSVVDGGKKPDRGGSLATRGGQMERSQQPGDRSKNKQSEGGTPKDKKLSAQGAIDQKYAHSTPTDEHIDGWLKDTALRVGKPTASSIQKATIEQLGDKHNLHTKGIKTLDAMTNAIHAKLKKTKPQTTLSEAKAIVDKAHKIRTERANADYKDVQAGDKVTIDRVGRQEAYKLPGNYGAAHRPAIEAHLSRTFSQQGGDSKVLGLKPGADFTVKELKDAYRSAAQKAHPDRGGSADKFQALKESYERLLPKSKSPAIDKVAEQTGMTREEVVRAVKRRKAN